MQTITGDKTRALSSTPTTSSESAQAPNAESPFDIFKRILQSADVPTAELVAAVDLLDATKAEVEADSVRLRDERRAMLTANEDVRDRHKAALATVEDQAADLALYDEEIRARLETAQAKDAEALRQTRYAEARSRRDAAAKTLESDYPKIGRQLQKLFRTVLEAEQAVDDANRDLPAGAEPLLPVEQSVRIVARIPEREISSRYVQRWIYSGTGHYVPDNQLAQIRDLGGGLGLIPNPGSASSNPNVERRWCQERGVAPPVVGSSVYPQLRELIFPALRGNEPAMLEPMMSGYVGDLIEDLDNRMAWRAAEPTPKIEITLMPKGFVPGD